MVLILFKVVHVEGKVKKNRKMGHTKVTNFGFSSSIKTVLHLTTLIVVLVLILSTNSGKSKYMLVRMI